MDKSISEEYFGKMIYSASVKLKKKLCTGLIATLASTAHTNVHGSPSVTGSWYPVPVNAKFLTGDSWSYETVTYRLWGVQACLRGTEFINSYNIVRDCGEVSLVVLVSMIKDLRPSCSTVIEDVPQRTRFIVCLSTISLGPDKGQRIDLATALITQGYAFAAHTVDGALVHAPYGVAEDQARTRKAGLWQFDFPDPNAIIARTLRGPAVSPMSGLDRQKP